MNLRRTVRRLRRSRAVWTASGVAASAAAVGGVTGVVFALRPVAPPLSLGVIYLFAVLPVAVVWGLRYALPVSLASMLALNFFFLPPVHTLRLRETENWVALAVYLVTAVVVSELAAYGRRRAGDAEQRGREASFAADVSAMLLEPGFVQDKAGRIAARVAGVLGVDRARIELESVRRPEATESAHRLAAGGRHVGQLFLDADAHPDGAVLDRVLPALASLVASALDREQLARRAVEAEALRRSDAVKTTILRTLSHDLRSPLTAIAAAGEVLDEDRGELARAERSELVATIRGEAARLERLVSNLLDLSRLEAGAARPRPELWTAESLVARALDAVGPAGAGIAVSLPDELPAVRADPAQIERVLVNFLENAVQSAGDGVELLVAVEGADVVWRVADQGPGVDARDAGRIFEPFERGTGEISGGTGLGLAIARGFAEANGGRVWAEAAPGGGAIFALALPRVAVTAARSAT